MKITNKVFIISDTTLPNARFHLGHPEWLPQPTKYITAFGLRISELGLALVGKEFPKGLRPSGIIYIEYNSFF